MQLIVDTSTAIDINNKMSLKETFERKELFGAIHTLPLDSLVRNNKENELISEDNKFEKTYDNEQGVVDEEKSQNTHSQKVINLKESDKSDDIDINLDETKMSNSDNLENNLLQNSHNNNNIADQETNTSIAILENETISTETISATVSCSSAIENDKLVESILNSDSTNETLHLVYDKKEEELIDDDIREAPSEKKDEVTENIEEEINETDHGDDICQKLELNIDVINENEHETKIAGPAINLNDYAVVEAKKNKSIDTNNKEITKADIEKNIDADMGENVDENIEVAIKENIEKDTVEIIKSNNNLSSADMENVNKTQKEFNHDNVTDSILIDSENKLEISKTQQLLLKQNKSAEPAINLNDDAVVEAEENKYLEADKEVIEADIEKNIDPDMEENGENIEAATKENIEADTEEINKSPSNLHSNLNSSDVENVNKSQQEFNYDDVAEGILINSENKLEISKTQQLLRENDAKSIVTSSENEPEIYETQQVLKTKDLTESISTCSENKTDISKTQLLLNKSDEAESKLLCPENEPELCKMQLELNESDIAESILLSPKNGPDEILREPGNFILNIPEQLEENHVSCPEKDNVAKVSEILEENFNDDTNINLKDQEEKLTRDVIISNLPTKKETAADAVVEVMDMDVPTHIKETEPYKGIDKEIPAEAMDFENTVDYDLTQEMSEQACPTAVKSNKISIPSSPISRLSNTLDILSDDEDETPKLEKEEDKKIDAEKQCINLEEDDDIMFIEEDTNSKEVKSESKIEFESKHETNQISASTDCAKDTSTVKYLKSDSPPPSVNDVEEKKKMLEEKKDEVAEITKPLEDEETKVESIQKPLLTNNFLSKCKKNLADMTRTELEEFCVHKIVESIVDRSSLSEIKSKLKTISQTVEEYKKKSQMIAKQNRDLQVVLKSVQEEQKKKAPSVTPLKITRSVGMQIVMADPNNRRKSALNTAPLINSSINSPMTQTRKSQTPRMVKQLNTPQIPVPRLVPASNSVAPKPPVPQPASVNNSPKPSSPVSQSNGVKNATPQKVEKRPFNRAHSVTVDLTDDEPAPKVQARNPLPPVRMVPQQNLLKPQFGGQVNNPRKVYIPISGTQTQNIRPGQIMLKAVTPQGLRPRGPINPTPRVQAPVRITRLPGAARHPAPLPDAMKQYQPPNWKAIPPAPDLKLSKVENGIVISWKIEDYQEDQFEEIASYQLYAYQETTSPPNTNLWKKIGDVKALPLPMACTLTQFMAGYRYYFAVRAVDIRSRLGPFSLPGSILLLSKNMNGTTVGSK